MQCLAHADDAVTSCRKAFREWSRTPLNDRIACLRKYQKLLETSLERVAVVISSETGKPYWEAELEVKAMINKIEISLNEGLEILIKKEIPNAVPGATGKLSYRPLGVVVVLGPFNFPGHLAQGHIVPALLLGNTVVFKPSEKTPLTGQLMGELISQSGFPKGVFNLVQGDGEIGVRLVTNDDVDGIFFTGSFEVGSRIRESTANHYWKKLALEMGSKTPMFVESDGDLDLAASEAVKSAFWTSGQRCASLSRLFVHRKVAEDLKNRVIKEMEKLVIGSPFDHLTNDKPKPILGPLIDSGSVDRFIRFQGIARRDGAETLIEGERIKISPEGHYVQPSLHWHDGLEKGSLYHNTEIFAPDLVIIPYDNLDHAIELANEPKYGLVSSVFTKNQSVFEKLSHELQVGHLNWNVGTIGASSKLPFGGLGRSGNFAPSGLFASYYCVHPFVSLVRQ